MFPELGGGGGLRLGKDRAAALVKAFGGRVTSAFSGRTTMVLVGKSPGRTTVEAARARADGGSVKLLTLTALKRGLKRGGRFEGLRGVEQGEHISIEDDGGGVVAATERLTIPRYSAGFVTRGNIARGSVAPRFMEGGKCPTTKGTQSSTPASLKISRKRAATNSSLDQEEAGARAISPSSAKKAKKVPATPRRTQRYNAAAVQSPARRLRLHADLFLKKDK